MKRKSTSKAITKRRRRNRLKKLKHAALSLGLVTAWGASADATDFGSSATATITLSSSAYIVDDRGASATATATITIEGINGPPSSGATGESSIQQQIVNSPDGGYYYVGVSGEDLVLSFPGGGASVIGEFWGDIFVDGQGSLLVSETEILGQLPLVNGGSLEPGSPLDLLNSAYGALLRTPFGEEATLVAFTNNTSGPNNGIAGGTTTLTIVPEPASWAFLATAAGLASLRVRRRE